jgi:mono/diheme cytochrome c family protein
MNGRAILIGAVGMLLAAGATGRVLADEPVAPAPAPAPAPVPVVMPDIYRTACAPCHANGGFGVRVLADRPGSDRSILHDGTVLPAAAIRAIVRNGMGHMPAMSRVEVSDAELDAIAAYLTRNQ